MQPIQWEYRPDGLRAPALVCAFKGWNDAADAASTALSFVGSALGARRFATIDPEEFYDFQATRPRISLTEGRARELVWPAVELYEARVPRAPARPHPARRRGAVVPVADILRGDRRAGRGARRPARGDARRAARRRPPHPRRVDHRPGLRPGADRAARARLVVIRGPDRDRRRAARRLPGGRAAVREPVGGRPPLHRGHPEPEGGARARAQARGPRRRRRRRVRARGRRRRLRAPGQPRGAERPGRAGVRRAARAGRRHRRGRRPRPAPVGRHDRPRPPAVPAPARRSEPPA